MSAGFVLNDEYIDVTHTEPTALGNESWWWQSSNLNPTRDYILPFGIAPATLTVSDDNNSMLYSATQSISSRYYGKLIRAKLIPEDTAEFTYTNIVYTKVSDTEFSISYTEHDVNAGESYNVTITYVLKESTFEMPIETFTLQDKTVTSNGNVTADQGYYGLGTVGINVPTTGNKLYAWARANDNWERIQWNTTAFDLVWSSVPSPEVNRILVRSFNSNNKWGSITLHYITVTETISEGRLRAVTNSSVDNNAPHTFNYIRYPSLDITF